MKTIVSVRFRNAGKTYYFDPAGQDIATGSYVIVDTSRGNECGEVTQGTHTVPDAAVPKDLKPVLRVADDADIRRMRQNRADEISAFTLCEEKIEKHQLPMKLIDVEYTYFRAIKFFFTSRPTTGWIFVSW